MKNAIIFVARGNEVGGGQGAQAEYKGAKQLHWATTGVGKCIVHVYGIRAWPAARSWGGTQRRNLVQEPK